MIRNRCLFVACDLGVSVVLRALQIQGRYQILSLTLN